MDVQEIQKLNNKLEMLLNIQKELAKELKRHNSDGLDLKVELDKVTKKVDNITARLDKLMNSRGIEVKDGIIKRNIRDFTDQEIFDMRQKTSLRRTADYLNCSVSSIQRICRRYKASLNKADDTDDEIIDY